MPISSHRATDHAVRKGFHNLNHPPRTPSPRQPRLIPLKCRLQPVEQLADEETVGILAQDFLAVTPPVRNVSTLAHIFQFIWVVWPPVRIHAWYNDEFFSFL